MNEPWLERQAINLEEGLVGCDGVLGASVTANFAENGFEIDFTAGVATPSEAYEMVGRVLTVVEKIGSFAIEAHEPDEIRSSWSNAEPVHEQPVAFA